MDKYCMYLRKSRLDEEAETRGEGDALKRHEAILLALAKQKNIVISEMYREVVSGETIASRPEMQRLLRDVENGLWKGVLVVEVERLARGDTIDQGLVAQTFKYSSTLIITPTKVYDPNNEFDEEYFEFGLFMSRREYKTIRRRLLSGRVSAVKEGKYVGSIPPYGYTKKKLERNKGFTLIPHPEQAPVVRLIFDLYVRGELQPDGTHKRLGVSLIARKLNEMKVQPPKGDAWTPDTIKGMLRNPVYAGKIRWNFRPHVKKMAGGQIVKSRPRAKEWLVVQGLHEPIVSEETFNLAQHFINQNPSHPIPRKYIIKNPLAGLIVCGKCGRKMIRRPYGNGAPDTLMCPHVPCDNVSSHLHIVEDRILTALERWLKQYKIDLSGSDNPEDAEIEVIKSSVTALDKHLNALHEQANNLHDLLEREVYTVEVFLERSRVIGEKIDQAKRDRDTLRKQLALAEERGKNETKIIPKVEEIMKIYQYLDSPAKKNELLKEVLEKAVYTKTVDCRYKGASPDDFMLDIYPRL